MALSGDAIGELGVRIRALAVDHATLVQSNLPLNEHHAKLAMLNHEAEEIQSIIEGISEQVKLAPPDPNDDSAKARLETFCGLVSQFQQLLSRLIDRSKSWVGTARRNSLRDGNLEDTAPQSGLQEQYSTARAFSRILQASEEAIQREIAYNEQLIRAREDGIAKIQSEMSELQEIYQDIGTLVAEQSFLIGTFTVYLIDNIEASIEQTTMRTRGAHEHLEAVVVRRRSRRGTLVIILLAFLLAVLILLILAIN